MSGFLCGRLFRGGTTFHRAHQQSTPAGAAVRSLPPGPDPANPFHSVCVQTLLPPPTVWEARPATAQRSRVPAPPSPRALRPLHPRAAGSLGKVGAPVGGVHKLHGPTGHLETVSCGKAQHPSGKTPTVDGTWLKSHEALCCALQSNLIL